MIQKYETTDHYKATYKGKQYKYSETYDLSTGDLIESCLLHDNGDIVLRYDEVLEYIQNNI